MNINNEKQKKIGQERKFEFTTNENKTNGICFTDAVFVIMAKAVCHKRLNA